MKEVDRVIEGTVEEAAALRTELRRKVRDDGGGAVQIPRLGDYATSWLKSRIVGLKASSSSRYAEVLDTYVLPYLGDFFLDRITESDVREWQARVAQGRAGATVNGALVMLKMVLEDAVDEYDLPKNPSAWRSPTAKCPSVPAQEGAEGLRHHQTGERARPAPDVQQPGPAGGGRHRDPVDHMPHREVGDQVGDPNDGAVPAVSETTVSQRNS